MMKYEAFSVRPAKECERDLFYSHSNEKNEELGVIGHVRIDFGKDGKEFWHSWWSKSPENLNTTKFKNELGRLVNQLRQNGKPLKDLISMRTYCAEHGGEISLGWVQNYGYIAESVRYKYCLRCNPLDGDYHAYLYCYDKFVAKVIDDVDDN